MKNKTESCEQELEREEMEGAGDPRTLLERVFALAYGDPEAMAQEIARRARTLSALRNNKGENDDADNS